MSAIGMPPHLLSLFQARRPLEFLKCPRKRKMRTYEGLIGSEKCFELSAPPAAEPREDSPLLVKTLHRAAEMEKREEELKEKARKYDPHAEEPYPLRNLDKECGSSDEDEKKRRRKLRKKNQLTGDPYKTLFVGKINYETTEKKLRSEFEQYGTLKYLRMPLNAEGIQPKGYAFIEYASERDMKEAYKHADGKKIDGRRVLVDAERSRTVAGWLPRRLAGGRGPPRGSNTKSNKRHHLLPNKKPHTKFTLLDLKKDKKTHTKQSAKKNEKKQPKSDKYEQKTSKYDDKYDEKHESKYDEKYNEKKRRKRERKSDRKEHEKKQEKNREKTYKNDEKYDKSDEKYDKNDEKYDTNDEKYADKTTRHKKDHKRRKIDTISRSSSKENHIERSPASIEGEPDYKDKNSDSHQPSRKRSKSPGEISEGEIQDSSHPTKRSRRRSQPSP